MAHQACCLIILRLRQDSSPTIEKNLTHEAYCLIILRLRQNSSPTIKEAGTTRI